MDLPPQIHFPSATIQTPIKKLTIRISIFIQINTGRSTKPITKTVQFHNLKNTTFKKHENHLRLTKYNDHLNIQTKTTTIIK